MARRAAERGARRALGASPEPERALRALRSAPPPRSPSRRPVLSLLFAPPGVAPREAGAHAQPPWAGWPARAEAGAEDVLLSCGADGEIRSWVLSEGACVSAVRAHALPVRHAKLISAEAADAPAAAEDEEPVGGADARARDAAARPGSATAAAAASSARTPALAEATPSAPATPAPPPPSRLLLVSGSDDGSACLWSVPQLELVAVLTAGHAHGVCGVASLDGGLTIATASLDGSVRLWDAASRACIVAMDIDGAHVMDASADNRVYVGTSDGCVTVVALAHAGVSPGHTHISLSCEQERWRGSGSTTRPGAGRATLTAPRVPSASTY